MLVVDRALSTVRKTLSPPLTACRRQSRQVKKCINADGDKCSAERREECTDRHAESGVRRWATEDAENTSLRDGLGGRRGGDPEQRGKALGYVRNREGKGVCSGVGDGLDLW
jgi:hypothetical protein